MSDKKSTAKEYTNGEVTIVWKSDICIHSANCVRGLPDVFDVKKQPWINAKGAGTDEIIDQVKKCPSGALSYYLNDAPEDEIEVSEDQVVEVMVNGPLLVYGNIRVKDSQGNEVRKSKVTAFCRCGASANKPYCDGSHRKAGFEG